MSQLPVWLLDLNKQTNNIFFIKNVCKIADNGIKHVVNECEKLKTEREKVLKYLNKINNTKNNELLKAIEYHYYSKRYYENKNESRDDRI